jgi:hypothetical protein
MISAAALLIAAVFLVQVLRPSPRDPTERPLEAGERYYALGATLPLLLCFAIPGGLNMLFGQEPSVRIWSNRVTNAGLWLSLGLTLIGAFLLWRASRGNRSPGGRLAAAVGLAALPASLVAVVIMVRLL